MSAAFDASEAFDAGWLALREPFDARARCAALNERLIATLPPRPHLVDLGAGTGSLFRALAPSIGRAQVWTFIDADEALLGAAFEITAAWADRHGWTVTWPGRALLVHTPRGAWRVEGLVEDLADPSLLAARRADAVVCSALLDLVSAAWLDRLAHVVSCPLLACLSLDGRGAWLPRHPADAIIAAAFRRDQRRDKGFGRALGVAAPAQLLRCFAARGFTTRSAPSDWRIPRSAARMAVSLIATTAEAARASTPARRGLINEWEHTRLMQARRGGLAIHLGHRDILALPP